MNTNSHFPIRLSASIIMILLLVYGCTPKMSTSQNPTDAHQTQMKYDSAYAKKLGADQYGMKRYVLAYLKKGPNRDRSPAEAAQLQRAHLDNISRMAEDGKTGIGRSFFGRG